MELHESSTSLAGAWPRVAHDPLKICSVEPGRLAKREADAVAEAEAASSIKVPEQRPAPSELASTTTTTVSKQEAHIMWIDRQEVYLSWAGIATAFVLAMS